MSTHTHGKTAAANDRTASIEPGLLKALREFQHDKGLSQNQLATRLGTSSAYVSLAFKDKFPGDVAAFERRVESLLSGEAANEREVLDVELVKHGFLVETMRQFLFSVAHTRDIGVAWCPAGRGKTCGIAVYLQSEPLAVCVTALKSLSGWRSIRDALLAALPVKRRGKGETWNQYIKRTFRGSERLLIIDNAHLLTESARQWLAYDWHEQTGCGLALVGNDIIVDQWKVNDQHLSRVGLAIEVTSKASAKDSAKAILAQFLPAAAHDAAAVALAARLMDARGAGRAVRKHANLARELLASNAADTPAAALKLANSMLLSDVKLAA
jgi:DNA transposition AAA+ family ATPase